MIWDTVGVLPSGPSPGGLSRAMTLTLSERHVAILEAVAKGHGITKSAAVRLAIETGRESEHYRW